MQSDKLELKIIKDTDENRNVDLSNMSLKESKSLTVLIESLVKIIELSTDSKDVRIQVIKGSATVVADGSTTDISAIQKAFMNVVENKSENKPLVESWRRIQELVWANGLEYQANFYQDGKITPILQEIKQSRAFKIRHKRTAANYKINFIEGQLLEVGGKIPNIHILDTKGRKITINCTQDEAVKVNTFLYKNVKLSVWAKVTSNSQYKFCDNYINDTIYNNFKKFIDSELEYDQFLHDLHQKIRSFLDEKDFGLLKKFLRLFNHPSVESSTIKTILILTKSFRENEDIKSMRLNLKDLLEQKRGRKLI